jgi:hypothetical protein
VIIQHLILLLLPNHGGNFGVENQEKAKVQEEEKVRVLKEDVK